MITYCSEDDTTNMWYDRPTHPSCARKKLGITKSCISKRISSHGNKNVGVMRKCGYSFCDVCSE
jgi:hypothetical protein